MQCQAKITSRTAKDVENGPLNGAAPLATAAYLWQSELHLPAF
jgi:hypothetical protein